MSYTVIHVTHEAVQKVGGIGAVLEGLITSPIYQKEVGRSFLVGPLESPEGENVLAGCGEVIFSTISGVNSADSADVLIPIADRYNVNLVYGKRKFSGECEADVLLVDAENLNPRLSRNFKYNLYRRFGLQSDLYESVPDYLLYTDIAEAAYDALAAFLSQDEGPHIVLAHEYMGMPLALKTLLVDDPRFCAIFYAHEVSTMRSVVENHPGHDVMFYNALADALEQGLTVDEVFGDHSDHYRHALVGLASHCDGIFAVGDPTLEELRFMGHSFQDYPIDLVYNGIPAHRLAVDDKLRARSRLQQYATNLLGFIPDVLMTHVTRPVVSKGLWRDLLVLAHADKLLAAQNKTGVFFVLTTAGGQRSPEDILRLEEQYGWPVVHRPGAPDLVGPEAGIWQEMDAFNGRSSAIKAVLVNQFGWDRASCGKRMPEDMGFADLRQGTDIEFGQSIYEPFGIAVLEPLTYGGICVPSSVCGCCGYIDRVTEGDAKPHVVVADYTSDMQTLESALDIGGEIRNRREVEVAEKTAWEIVAALPQSDDERASRLDSGYNLAARMSWDRVCESFFMPGIKRAISRRL